MAMDIPDLSQLLAERLADGIIVASESGIVYVNPSGLRLLGADRSEEVVGKPLAVFLRPDEFPELFQQAALRRGDVCATPIFGNLLRLDGSSVEVCLSSLPILWQGTFSCLLVIAHGASPSDASNRTPAEAYPRESPTMETIGMLAGGIAHEFNNSLTAVLGFSQLALPLIPTDNKAHRYIQQVIDAGRKSNELIHQLLMFSRRSDETRHPLLLHVLVKEALKLLRPTIPTWIELREQIADSISPIEADATQMRQMFVNLVVNAVHAMRRAGGVLDIEVQDEELSADRTTPYGQITAGRYVCLRVKDSGEGVEPEVGGEERRMGLSVVHGIVSTHRGTVLVDSRPGLGTTVAIFFPTLTPHASLISAKDDTLPRGHECILFVDSEESRATRGREMLESLGYDPVVRTSATEAWKAFNRAPQRFDLLIADQTMPDMSGDQLVRECRQLRPDLPVILCAGSEEARSPEEARLLGVAELILKPLVVRDLAHAIRRVLDRSPQSLALPSAASNPNHESRTPLIEESDVVSPRG